MLWKETDFWTNERASSVLRLEQEAAGSAQTDTFSRENVNFCRVLYLKYTREMKMNPVVFWLIMHKLSRQKDAFQNIVAGFVCVQEENLVWLIIRDWPQ